MKYTVCWRPTAERKLNEIWNETADKPAVSQAANAQSDRVIAVFEAMVRERCEP